TASCGPPPPNNNGPPLVVRPNRPAPDLRSMEELCQPSINGRGEPIARILIQATDFGLRHHMIQQVQNTCQFHRLPGDDANRHIDKFLEVTQHMKQNGVSDDALRLSLFPYSLTHHATAWNEIMKFRQDLNESLFEAWEHYKLSIDRCPNHNMLLVTQIDTFYNGLTLRHRDTINAVAGGIFMQNTPKECYELIENMTAHHNHWDTSATRDETSRTISSTTTTESPEVVRQLEMMNKNFLDMMRQIQSVKSVSPKCETCGDPHSFTECPAVDGYTQEASYATTAGPSNELTNYIKSNKDTLRAMQTQMTNMKTELRNEFKSSLDTRTNKKENQNNQIMNMITNLTMQKQSPSGSGSLPSNTVANPRGDMKAITTRSGVSYDGPTIPPTPSPLPKEVERETEAKKDKVQITSSESTAHVQHLVFQVSILELEVALKPKPKPPIPYPSRLNDQKLREKANTQTMKFLQIFQRLHFDIRFADALLHMLKFASTFKSLLSNKEKLFELANTLLNAIARRWSLRSFPKNLETPAKLTLRVNDEANTFKVGHTSRYSRNYYETVNQIDVIDVTCEECAQEVLDFWDSSKSDNPTSSLDPIITTSSPSLTPFEGGDFILEEIEACLTSDSIPPEIDDADFDLEVDILLLEKLLNDDPSSPLPLNELNFEELKIIKSSIDDPPKLELKDIPSHLEYAFLEGINKLPVIIAKNLKDKEKARILKVLKSHKRAIAWKISDIKGIDPQFFIKLLDAGLIYPISDNPWLNDATGKDHFSLLFMDQMLERLAGNEYYCFLDGFSGYFQIPIDPQDQEKTTFTCPYGTFAYLRMPFGLCNASGTFQRCMMTIFHGMIEETMEVFMDDFSVFGDSFSLCLSYLDKMLKWCEDTNLVLN
ncbi:reverse transcriptase domain-containing protein, partial [Tanacetum coccineum]